MQKKNKRIDTRIEKGKDQVLFLFLMNLYCCDDINNVNKSLYLTKIYKNDIIINKFNKGEGI